MTKTARITGGAGFIGSALTTPLLQRYGRVVVIDNLLPQVHPQGKPALGFDTRAELVEADVRDSKLWHELASQMPPEVVVHLAAETGTGQSLTESSRHTSTNVLGTSLMLDALQAQKAFPKRILLCSSRAVYGEGMWVHEGSAEASSFYPGMRSSEMLGRGQWDFTDAKPLPMNAQNTQRNPESVYGVTKCAQEDLLSLWGDAFGVETVILRLQNVYGPGQTPDNPYTGIMSIFSRLAGQGKVIPLYEDGLMRRDFVYIDDVVTACLQALRIARVPRYPLDIGSGIYTTVAEAARILAQIYNAPAPQVTGQWRHGDVRHAWADAQPAAEALNFRAQISLAQGLERLTDWIQDVAR